MHCIITVNRSQEISIRIFKQKARPVMKHDFDDYLGEHLKDPDFKREYMKRLNLNSRSSRP